MTQLVRTAATPETASAATGTGPQGRRTGAGPEPLVVNAMSVDVEDWFQVQAFADRIDRGSWDHQERRVEANTNRLLDRFAEAGVHATFFTLAWIAERAPGLIRRIVDDGHELASHGLEHRLVREQTPEAFRADVTRSKEILEDIGGVPVRGYRAATFSVGADTPWAWDVLGEAGYAYSSSINPIRHDLYGMPDAPRFPFRPREGAAMVEVPMTTVRLAGRNLPCAGGGFFRLLPYSVFSAGVRRVNRRDGRPAVFYCHPWEVDPGQPRVAGLSRKSAFRHYLNLSRTEGRLVRLLCDFAWDRMDRAVAECAPPA